MTEPGARVDLFFPVRSANAFEDTVERLLQTIRLGVVAPGESLPPERELAMRLAVSRDTVREAIRSLAEAGYLESRRGRYGGTFVRSSLPESRPTELPVAVEDVLAVREILEVGTARLAAGRRLTVADRESLRARMAEVEAATPADYRRLDSRLHLSIAELVGAPSLLPLLPDNRMQVNRLLDAIPLLPRNIAHSDRQHRALVGAIVAGDSEAAAAAMEEHLAGTAALLRGFLT